MKLSQTKTISDMHVHLIGVPSEKDFFELLDFAEANGVKNLALLEYSNLCLYKSGLWNKVKDKIREHYSGKLISAIEFVSTIDNIVSPYTGFEFGGCRSDIVLYDFDPEKLMPYFDDKYLESLWECDKECFIEKLQEHGFLAPEEIFVNDACPSSFAANYLDFLTANPEEKVRFTNYFNLPKLDIPSDITRNLMQPNKPLYFPQKLYPFSTEIFRIANKVGGRLCLAHPAYMSVFFNTEDYIRTMFELSNSSPEFKPFEFISGPYMLDRKEDTAVIDKLSNELGLKQVPTSDVQTHRRRLIDGKDEPVMYCITEINGKQEKIYYKPRPGFAICPFIETYLKEHGGEVKDFDDLQKCIDNAPANLFMDENLANTFSDVREYFGMNSHKEL